MPDFVDVTTPSESEIVVARMFDAGRGLIWDWHTQPDLVRRWLFGPDGWTMPVCDIELRVGGSYRYRWRNTGTGLEFGTSGQHREIDAPARLVTTERMDGFEGESVNTMDLSDLGGRTLLTVTMRFPSTAIRDAALRSGMTTGMAQSYDRLERLLRKARRDA